MRTDLQEISTHSDELGVNKTVNILKTCRLCMLTGNTRMESIFQVCIRMDDEGSVAEKITSVTQLNPCIGDGLPTVVCQQCMFQLDVAEAFIQRCKQSDTSLRSILKQEAAHNQGAKGSSKQNSQPVVTSILAPLAGRVVFTPTDQTLGTAPNLGTSKSRLILPPLSSKQCTLSENKPATKRRAEAVAKPIKNLLIRPSDNFNASVKVTEDAGCNHESSSSHLVGTLGDQMTTRLHLEPASNISHSPPQQSRSDPGIHAQIKNKSQSNSQLKEMPGSGPSDRAKAASDCEILSATARKEDRLVAAAAAIKWVCSDCGLLIDRRTTESRHMCRTCVVPQPPGACESGGGPPSTRVLLIRPLLPGQLSQLQKQASVAIQRLPEPTSSCGTESRDDSMQSSSISNSPYRDYMHEQRKLQLLHEMLALKRMRQRLQARLAPMAEAEERETVKLTQLKFKLKTKLQQPLKPTEVVCSPDVSVHLGAVTSVAPLSNADMLPPAQYVQVKVESVLEEPVKSSPRRNKRRLVQTESPRPAAEGSKAVCSTNQTEGINRKIKTEPMSEGNENYQIVNKNVNQYCSNKKIKFKQSH